ncbi:RlpA-like double-psi beta-barrel-protein domain-containing protein-containing protein [Biscogniauxia mediterranea]|nr:RlpA-like double-psi beta-barrel-protein domain-containing protein-containing protein [Biscogniauxia mediterranea]
MFSLAQIAVALSCAVGYAAAAPVASPSSASTGTTFTGDITYYTPGLGACGSTSTDTEHVVALASSQFSGSDPCGKTIEITKDGKTTTATVVDKCPSCAEGAIDVSSTVFESIADLSVGRTTVTWKFTS